MVQFSVQSTQLSEGYAAFNANSWDAVQELFCEDTPDSENPEFPAWYPMGGGDPKKGRQAILELLQGLRADGVKAQLLGVADHGDKSLTLDVTLGGDEGPHACADKVEFDESGRIKVFWHCATNTHGHGHAGHPAGHPHPPTP